MNTAITAEQSVPRTTSKLSFIGYAATSCAANTTWWMQPLLIGYWVASQTMSESAAGFVVSMEMGAMSLSGAILARVLTQGRLVSCTAIGLLVAIIASFFSLHATSFAALVALRTVVGLGIGAVLMVAFMAVSRTEFPDKVFARVNLVNLMFGMMLIGSLSFLRTVLPGATPLHALIISLVVLLLPTMCIPHSLRFLPANTATQQVADTSATSSAQMPLIWLLAASVVGLGIVSGVAFATSALTGAQLGLGQADIDGALTMAIFIALPTTGVAALVGTRFGRVLPVAISLSCIGGTIVLLSTHPSLFGYRLAISLNIAGLYFALPYLFGAGAALDTGGKGGAYVGSAFTLAGAISPFLGGVIIQFLGIRAVAPLACLVLLLVVLGLAFVEKQITKIAAP